MWMMMRLWTFAFAAILLGTLSASGGGAKGGGAKNNNNANTKILADIQKLLGEINEDNAKRKVDLAKTSADWDAKITAARGKDTKAGDALQKLHKQKQAALDTIDTAYANTRMTFVATNNKLRVQHADLVQMRDNALADLTGDAYNTTAARYNAQIRTVNAEIVLNDNNWKTAHDQRIADVAAIDSKYDPQIQKLAGKDNTADGKLNILVAGKQKALAAIVTRHDTYVNSHNARINKLQSQIK